MIGGPRQKCLLTRLLLLGKETAAGLKPRSRAFCACVPDHESLCERLGVNASWRPCTGPACQYSHLSRGAQAAGRGAGASSIASKALHPEDCQRERESGIGLTQPRQASGIRS